MEEELNAKYGVGKWHCDDIWQDETSPACVRAFLQHARAPAHGLFEKDRPPLFATRDGRRVRVVMASRFGDVGITPNLKSEMGYERRVFLPELSNFSAEP